MVRGLLDVRREVGVHANSGHHPHGGPCNLPGSIAQDVGDESDDHSHHAHDAGEQRYLVEIVKIYLRSLDGLVERPFGVFSVADAGVHVRDDIRGKVYTEGDAHSEHRREDSHEDQGVNECVADEQQ